MEEKKLEKDLVFYNPGKPGQVFTLKSGNFVSQELLSQTIDHLKFDTEKAIEYVEERRLVARDN